MTNDEIDEFAHIIKALNELEFELKDRGDLVLGYACEAIVKKLAMFLKIAAPQEHEYREVDPK